jgi:hypothetical protein
MFADVAPYLMALAAMSFAALSALTIIRSVNRFDPPEVNEPTAPPANVAAPADHSHDPVAA